MSTLITERDACAEAVSCSADALVVRLDDGRQLTVPLAWFPRLLAGSSEERNRYELIGGGSGIHWPDLDEDISVEGLLAGRRSAESPASLGRWLDRRREAAGQH